MWSFPVGVTLKFAGAIENIAVPLNPLLDGLWILGTRNSAVVIVTMVLVSLSGVRIPIGERDFSLFQIVLTGPVAHPASYSVGTGVHSVEESGWSGKLSTHRHQVMRLGMSGGILPLLPYMRSWRRQGQLYLLSLPRSNWKPDSSVSILIRIRAKRRKKCVNSRQRKKILYSPKRPVKLWIAPASYGMDTDRSTPRGKADGVCVWQLNSILPSWLAQGRCVWVWSGATVTLYTYSD